MAATIQPEWLKGHQPNNTTSNTKWVKGMPSPHPQGRPKGIVDKRTRVTQALMDDAPAVARVVIDAALNGDVAAAGLVLARVAPALKAQGPTVEFYFDATAPSVQQVEAVLQAIAGGKVSVDTGKQIIEAIEALSAVRAIEELEKRLTVLEEKT